MPVQDVEARIDEAAVITCGGAGILADGSLRSTITGCQMMDERSGTDREQTHGVQEVNSADYTVVSGCIAHNHITADYDVTGTNSSVS